MDNQRSILFVSHRAKRGGAEKVLMDYLERSQLNHSINHVVAFEEGELIDKSSQWGYQTKVIQVGEKFNSISRKKASFSELVSNLMSFLSICIKLICYVKTNKINLMVANSVKADIVAGIVGLIMRRKVMIRFHDIIDSSEFNKITRLILIYIFKFSVSKILAVSNAVKEALVRCGIQHNKIEVIYNGIEIPKDIQPINWVNFNISPDGYKVVLVGRLTPWKGQDVAIKAWKRIVASNPKIQLVIIGDATFDNSDYQENLKQLVENNELESYVHFIGFQEKPLNFIASADLLIHTSIAPDPLPTVILEAVSLGKYVIATDVGGVREIIDTKQNGSIIVPKDDQVLAQEIIGYFENLSSPQTMNNLSEIFSMQKYVHEVDRVFESYV